MLFFYPGRDIDNWNLPDSRFFELIERFGVCGACIEGLGEVGVSILGGCVFLHRGGVRCWVRYHFGNGRLHACAYGTE